MLLLAPKAEDEGGKVWNHIEPFPRWILKIKLFAYQFIRLSPPFPIPFVRRFSVLGRNRNLSQRSVVGGLSVHLILSRVF